MTDTAHDRFTDEYDCIISGGGPAGIVAGLLLARGGVKVVVLEKHTDFFRDFRGDTIHPSTLRLLDELGLYNEFARITHRRVTTISLIGDDGRDYILGDLSRLHTAHPFMTIAPQWDFLNLLAKAGEDEAGFDLRMGVEMSSLIWDDDRVIGVRAQTPEGEAELRAPLVVAADGRWSKARDEAALSMRELRSTIDVWWFRIDTTAQLADTIAPRAKGGNVFVAIPRDGHVQMARLIPKGEDARFREQGIESLRGAVAETFPALADDVATLRFDDVKLLDVRRNEARRWFVDGLLCIGDSAHAMSPLGGDGVNLAVQDGVATARLLAEALRTGNVSTRELRRVQRRRMLTTKAVELLQGGIHAMIEPVVHNGGAIRPPAPILWLLTTFPALTVVPTRILGMGVTAEHAPGFARRQAERV
ncbi:MULTISPECIES: FAD-dependent oxidoreductase [Brevibacterium]|uniref:2-polyprenyl-6-methoxyphenol hydroxylase n=2 Tax=Brevibacterium antiquum TaxID=234835 RepID=A0A2H1KP08_9MICO|nr:MULTISPECIES: FAD-dependent oxidoreductase [Brevibacterium]SMY01387.1 2-polyprenyl-6-methoxyphenol hydroxylase [Brevibacterium antiquum]SMY01490.1 2-polyprenyl-6-methoxyphenol hydroxylase [Brevibacterium antiquum CNRZ 918]HCG56063.1 FAD-dependent oxidoreductase [Brevibacterium sp.]